MGREFMLPDLGSGLKEGELVRWAVRVGDAVAAEDPLCEIETEKAVIEIPAPYDGVIARLGCAEGETIDVGGVLVEFEGETEAPAGNREIPSQAADSHEKQSTGQTDDPPSAGHRPPAAPSGRRVPTGRVRAMPAVRRLARELGVDLADVRGTGKRGRVTRTDVEEAAGASAGRGVGRSPPTGAHRRFSMLRRSIAAHMSRSWREIPHVFTRMQVDATGMLHARRALSEQLGRKVPLETFLIEAALPALREYPEFNAVVVDDGITYYDRYNIGVAVNTEDGLLVPVVHDADGMNLPAMVDRLADLLQRTARRTAAPAELTGATFTVNNIGALGPIMGTSIIPEGTTAIMSVGRATDQAVVRDGSVVVRPMAELALTFDHRAIDGGRAQRFLSHVTGLFEGTARRSAS